MNRISFLTLFCVWLALGKCHAQNPIIHDQFTADPTAKVFGGRLYLFPSHDIISPIDPERRWFAMADYHMFSTDNLTDWTDHGVILSQEQVPWGNPKGYSMWAPDCVEKDGKYYFFFPDGAKPVEGKLGGGFGVGVAISDNLSMPNFKPEKTNIPGIMGIDPCVLQTSKGENYIFWGGGGLRVAKMKDNLLELADEELQNATEGPHGMKFYGHAISELPHVGLQEGPFAFERNGKFYLTYPYVRYKKGDVNEDGVVQDNPTEALVYAMSDNPKGPYEYKGVIMKEHKNGCWTNHHSIVNFKGQWYLFYHHNDYSPSFDKNRSVCVDSLTFNADGTIQEVIPTLRGVGVTDCSSQIQMDRYSHIGGGATIAYNDTTNCFLGWKTILPKGGWVSYGNVSVNNEQVTSNNYDYQSSPLRTWISMPGFFGRSQIVDIKDTQLSLKVNKQPNGLYELVLMNNGNRPTEVDWISMSEHKPLVPASAGGLSTGSYRNLFVEAGHSQEEVEAKLKEVFNDVFVNNKTKCYFEVGKDKAYISDVKNNDVRTEGISYGLMIAVQFDRKDIFDRLWRWAKEYMQMTDGSMKGYFRWSCKRDGTANAQGPASDGELYFITSLIFASNRWGNTGDINYLKEAQYILDCIQPKKMDFPKMHGMNGKPHEKPVQASEPAPLKDGEMKHNDGEMKHNDGGFPPMMRGSKRDFTIALIDSTADIISFVPGMPFTDPSYNIPAFYEVWARYAEDGRATYWRKCASKCREYLHKSINPITGLNPDYNNFDGSLMHGKGVIGDAFRYDSWRVPMNIALDYSWACADKEWQQKYGETIQNFLYKQGVDTFVDQYNVDGTCPDKLLRAGNYPEKLRHSIGLVATSAAASIMCSHPKSYEFIERLWNAKHEPDADGYFDAYYDGLLRLFAFMHLSGHYRVIEKTPQMKTYFKQVTKDTPTATTDEDGFVRRWTLRDPINKPNQSNTVFTDSYMNETFPTPIQITKKDKAAWHTFDSQLYHSKLYRFATCTGQQRYGVIFWATTTIECDQDMEVRFGIGSNSASKWWLNGNEVAMLSGDRRMVRDDLVTAPVILHKGKNVITGAVINGPGMSDFCFRIIDKDGKPVSNVTIK